MIVNLAVMAMGRRIQPYICLLTSVVLWTLTSVQETLEIGTSSYRVTDKKFMQIPSVPFEFVGFFCRGTKAAKFLF